jgi:hypothetical protein
VGCFIEIWKRMQLLVGGLRPERTGGRPAAACAPYLQASDAQPDWQRINASVGLQAVDDPKCEEVWYLQAYRATWRALPPL